MPLEKTFVIFKPDASGLEDVIINEILSLKGIEIINQQYVVTTHSLIKEHYLSGSQGSSHYGEKYISHHKEILNTTENITKYGEFVISNLCKYMGNKILLTVIFEGENAVSKIRGKVGTTEPASAPEDTIRGKYGKDSYLLADGQGRNILNLVHCSDSAKEAEREIYLWLYPELWLLFP